MRLYSTMPLTSTIESRRLYCLDKGLYPPNQSIFHSLFAFCSRNNCLSHSKQVFDRQAPALSHNYFTLPDTYGNLVLETFRVPLVINLPYTGYNKHPTAIQFALTQTPPESSLNTTFHVETNPPLAGGGLIALGPFGIFPINRDTGKLSPNSEG